ncbi:MAG: hypothetical protein LBP28_05750 [Coriobacteriales bacterium]|nr:hypothetical protein [Coriobacteriales bacterium]
MNIIITKREATIIYNNLVNKNNKWILFPITLSVENEDKGYGHVYRQSFIRNPEEVILEKLPPLEPEFASLMKEMGFSDDVIAATHPITTDTILGREKAGDGA